MADNIDVRWWVRTAEMRARVAATVLLWLIIRLIDVLLLVLCEGSLRHHSRQLCLAVLLSTILVVAILCL